jgi:hypothetical protein
LDTCLYQNWNLELSSWNWLMMANMCQHCSLQRPNSCQQPSDTTILRVPLIDTIAITLMILPNLKQSYIWWRLLRLTSLQKSLPSSKSLQPCSWSLSLACAQHNPSTPLSSNLPLQLYQLASAFHHHHSRIPQFLIPQIPPLY